MQQHIRALDEFFMENYSDFTHLGAVEGYKAPDRIVLGKDGNMVQRPESVMLICHQSDPEGVLAALKRGLADTWFSFSFAPVSPFRRFRDRFRRDSFAHLLPQVLARCSETAESAGQKLSLQPEVWKGIVKGQYYPEKGTILALALVCRMSVQDAELLLDARGFALDRKNVRDVVVDFLLRQRVYSPVLRNECLREYAITGMCIKEGC